MESTAPIGNPNTKQEGSIILPPDAAVKLVWSMTGLFRSLVTNKEGNPIKETKDEYEIGVMASKYFEDIKGLLKSESTTDIKKNVNTINTEGKCAKDAFDSFTKTFIAQTNEEIKKFHTNHEESLGKITKNLQSITNSGTSISSELGNITLDKKEVKYLRRALPYIYSSLRELEVIYHGRQSNFNHIRALSEKYRENIKDEIKFGSSVRDYLKAIPWVGISGGTGITAVMILDSCGFELCGNYCLVFKMFLPALSATLGGLLYYFVTKWGWKKAELSLIKLDHDSNIYYIHYLNRCKKVLYNLNKELSFIHQDIFGNSGKYFKPIFSDKNFILTNSIGDSVYSNNSIEISTKELKNINKRINNLAKEIGSYSDSSRLGNDEELKTIKKRLKTIFRKNLEFNDIVKEINGFNHKIDEKMKNEEIKGPGFDYISQSLYPNNCGELPDHYQEDRENLDKILSPIRKYKVDNSNWSLCETAGDPEIKEKFKCKF
jgi:hypothetical protein